MLLIVAAFFQQSRAVSLVSGKHSLHKLKQSLSPVQLVLFEEAPTDDPYCPVLSVFNMDCPSCFNNVYQGTDASGAPVSVTCGHWMMGTSPQTCGSGPCPSEYEGLMCGPYNAEYPCCIDSSNRAQYAGSCTAKAAVDNSPPMAGPVCGVPNDLSSRSNICPLPNGETVDCRLPEYNPGVVEGSFNALCCPQTVTGTTTDQWQQYTCYNGAETGDSAQWCVPMGSNGWCTVCIGNSCGDLGR
eukprot:gb/GEZN01007043.1/.p1 GENE.gb/GEZN01007043.1/~~gb/GEZN01007043.1/.p1  ORF type:complete len:242 (+),score=12.15 gb/GEZN01007043.1/:104-829(+)